MPGPIKHHIIPQCYMKGFTDERNDIWTMKILGQPESRIRKSKTAGTAYENNYFTITNSRPLGVPLLDDPLTVELKRNKLFEDKLPRLWNNFNTFNRHISVNKKYEIVQIIFHLKMRSRRSRSLFFNNEDVEKLMMASVDDLANDPTGQWNIKAKNLGLTKEEYKQLYARLFKEIIIDKGDNAQFHNGYLLRESREDTLQKRVAFWRLVQARWTILHAQDDLSFVLGDSPGNSIADNGEIFNHFGREKFKFHFPINSKMTLRIDSFSRFLRYSDLPTIEHEYINGDEVDLINAQYLSTAYTEVYGSSQHILSDLRNRILPKIKRRNLSVDDINQDFRGPDHRFVSDSWL